MTEICIIKNTAALIYLGGDPCIWGIQDYVIYGVLLFLAGLLIASFIPSAFGKKLGLGMVLVGLGMAIGFPLIKDLWLNSPTFQLTVYGIAVFVMIMIILFPKTKELNIK